MKKTVLLTTIGVLFSCSNNNPITEQEVRDTILGMFDSFSVESDSKDNFYNFVTDDYILYEMGKAMTAADFIEFANSANNIT